MPLLPDMGEVMAFTAHDVRHMGVCPGCKGLLDKRQAVPTDVAHWHGKCAFDALGADGLVALPAEATRKVTLADVGHAVMRRLLDRCP